MNKQKELKELREHINWLKKGLDYAFENDKTKAADIIAKAIIKNESLYLKTLGEL